MTSLDEQQIQALLSGGNDEQIARLACALLDLKHDQVMQRVEILLQLGERSLALALSREVGLVGRDIEEASTRLDAGLLVFPPQTVRDLSARDWYHEAIQYIEAAIEQAPATFDTSVAVRLVRLARTLYGERLEEMIATSDCDLIVASDGTYLTKKGEARLLGACSGEEIEH
jgi:hypothetical protein